jgi:hypothetical protein
MTLRRWIACLAFAAGAAHAHDTWFAALPDGSLTLATGNRFPLADTAVDIRYFVRSGCRAVEASVAPRALEHERYTDKATVLRIARTPSTTASPAACFVQLAPFDLDLPLDKVDVYFKEIRPSDAVRAACTRAGCPSSSAIPRAHASTSVWRRGRSPWASRWTPGGWSLPARWWRAAARCSS